MTGSPLAPSTSPCQPWSWWIRRAPSGADSRLRRLDLLEGGDLFRSTVRATKLREIHGTERTSKCLTKRHKSQMMPVRRYRTQEVAGSSPASSIAEKRLQFGALPTGFVLPTGSVVAHRGELA